MTAKAAPPRNRQNTDPRHLCAELLIQVTNRKRPLDEALESTLIDSGRAGHDRRDRAFIRQLASTTLRRLFQIDATLALYMHAPLPDKARYAQALLRQACAECLFLNTPDHAVVDSAVRLAQLDQNARPYKKLVNAVLRKITVDRSGILAGPVANVANAPDWLIESWRSEYGDECTRRIVEAHTAEPPTDINFKSAADARLLAPEMNLSVLPNGYYRRHDGGQVENWPGFAEGRWWIQDAAAAIPVQLLGDIKRKSVIDLCAAPGGKTAQMASKGAEVCAVDRSAARLSRLEANLKRLNLTATIINADAADWRPAQPADFVLLDAPCSATGTIRRHPDIPLLKKKSDVETLAKAQARLLTAAAEMTAVGGTLIYCTCSLQPKEGPAQIETFLANRSGWKRNPVTPAELPGLTESITPDGDVRTLPCYWSDAGGMDGFYISRLRRH